MTDTEGETPPQVDAGGRPQGSGRPGLVVIFPRSADTPAATHPIRGNMVAGRGSGAAVELPDSKISRRHAEIEPCPGGFQVTDCGSRNGTFIDGAPLERRDSRLAYGSVVRFANTLLLAIEDTEMFGAPPRRLRARDLGTAKDVVAGPMLSAVWDMAVRVSLVDHPVLVLGESGSGKEIVARLIHGARYAGKPFIALNLAAIPDGLFESELFGHERGAFTGAVGARLGALREAQGGVVFLDEVGELRADLQVKLLRALDTCRVRPLGAKDEVKVDVRVVAATNRDLREAVSAGTFREDLFYRLASIEIRVPPLRDRKDDILLLASLMLRDENPRLKLSTDAAEVLALAPWRGNVRNLRRSIAAAAMATSQAGRTTVEAHDLPDLEPIDSMQVAPRGLTADRLRLAMARAGGVVQRAAKDLGIARSSFYAECKRLGFRADELRRR